MAVCNEDRATCSAETERMQSDSDIYCCLKTVVEWFAAAALLIVFAPLLVVLAAMVKLASRGPAFYSQTRLGKDGRHYRIFKLRTMTHNCESTTGPVWAAINDRRVTRLGRILRDTHLDELPQLWNVLRGEMSLIGPRPERPEIAHRIESILPEFNQRLQVKPGMTGLAQLRLPADTDIAQVQHKLAHDLYYLENLGPVLDLKIIASTGFHVLATGFGTLSRLLLVGAPAVRQQINQTYKQEVETTPRETVYVELAPAA
jgi:lipopolysaccharide/colanic/teichoic acid biosynthesis glycosyltransferase